MPAVIVASPVTVEEILSPLPAGTNNIGDVDVVSSALPTGASTSALQTTGNSTLSSIDTKILTDAQLRATAVPVSGTVTSNIGTTGGLALDATLTGGTQKSISRGGAKGTTTAADITSTPSGANHQPMDVLIYDASGNPITSFGGGTQYADNAARGTATGTLMMVDDGSLIQSALGDSSGRLFVNNSQWIGSSAPTVGQKVMASSLPVTFASDQTPLPVSIASSNAEEATFSVIALSTAIGNNKSMISIVNAIANTKIVKIRRIFLRNPRTAAITGVTSDFRLIRITGHSGGTLITPQQYDTTDALPANVTARTGSTVSGESASPIDRWIWSSDDWGPGTLDQEGLEHSFQNVFSIYDSIPDPSTKNLRLRPGEGMTIKHVTNSTAGEFDIFVIFTEV